jgi:hypothetical protein
MPNKISEAALVIPASYWNGPYRHGSLFIPIKVGCTAYRVWDVLLETTGVF